MKQSRKIYDKKLPMILNLSMDMFSHLKKRGKDFIETERDKGYSQYLRYLIEADMKK